MFGVVDFAVYGRELTAGEEWPLFRIYFTVAADGLAHEYVWLRISLTDPDARSMATSGRGTGIVGYNVQTAVDTKHHLIVAHEVTTDGHDRDQLSSMCGQARDAIGTTTLTAFADRGYFKGEEILECERAGIKTLVLKPQTSGNQAAWSNTM